MILFLGLRTLVEFYGEVPLGGFLSDGLPSKQGYGQHHLLYPSQFTLISPLTWDKLEPANEICTFSLLLLHICSGLGIFLKREFLSW